ncbi:tyrosine-type recombinase/integrase, partial [bacterium]|nr:tyrosine-type recombinase/integrase [bacterium]
NLTQYNIHFHGLRHTYSNMLFEADQNPKVIQNLLGHKDVKTTISTYNSVDKSYFEKATNVLNEQFKENDNKKIVEQIKDDDIDKIIEMLQKRKQQELEQQEEYEREQKKKKKQSDMEM